MSSTEEFSSYLARMQLKKLREFVDALRSPVWECELMRVAFPEANLISGTALQMYRWHFVLFHALYRLADEYSRAGKYLHIDFMGTCLYERPAEKSCQVFVAEMTKFCGAACVDGFSACEFHRQNTDQMAIDRLSDRYFYADESNFSALAASHAEKFLSGAWHLLQNHDDYLLCLHTLDLPDGVTKEQVKKRFRHLARTMHPDISEHSSEEFAIMNAAYRKLLIYLGG